MDSTNMLRGSYIQGVNLTDYLDQKYLPGRKYDGTYDPEGILSTMPAIVTALLGIFAGLLLKKESLRLGTNPIAGGIIIALLALSNCFARWYRLDLDPYVAALLVIGSLLLGILAAWLLHKKENTENNKVCLLLIGGTTALLVGWLWGTQFPVIKKIWTSSYVLVAGGYSAILLGAFYWIVDVRKWRAWCQPFVWIGMNPITLYLTSNFLGGLGFEKLARRLAGGPVKSFFDTHVAAGFGELFISAVGVALFIWFAHFLYRRKIFLRL
jgi:predicted acyltransferase